MTNDVESERDRDGDDEQWDRSWQPSPSASRGPLSPAVTLAMSDMAELTSPGTEFRKSGVRGFVRSVRPSVTLASRSIAAVAGSCRHAIRQDSGRAPRS